MERASVLCSEGADGDLASSAQAVEKSAFAGGRGTGARIVEKREQVASPRITLANFDPESSLPSCWAQNLGRDDLPDPIGFAESIQARRGQDDGVVFALLKLAQARINVAAQGMNIEISADGLELRLTAQA